MVWQQRLPSRGKGEVLGMSKDYRDVLNGKLPSGVDSGRLQSISQSADGQKVRAMLGDERELMDAIQNGDTAALKKAMETVLRSEEGKRLFGQLSAVLGRP